MRWALAIAAWVSVCAAPGDAKAEFVLLCSAANASCPVSSSAVAGTECTCSTGGVSVPGHVVIFTSGDDAPSYGSLPWSRSNSRGMHPSLPLPPAYSAARRSARPGADDAPALQPPTTPAPNPVPLQPARALRLGSAIPDPGVGAYGVVALPATATPDTQDRLARLCRAFLASLPAQSSLPATVALADQMLTYWPVTTASDEQCNAMLANYDLFAGQRAIRDAAAHNNDVSDRGPYLIGWSPSASRDVPDAIVLVLDLSSLESERSFTDAFQFWQQRVVEDPSLWRNGFSMFLVRRAARDFADHYGSDILKALHLSASDETK